LPFFVVEIKEKNPFQEGSKRYPFIKINKEKANKRGQPPSSYKKWGLSPIFCP